MRTNQNISVYCIKCKAIRPDLVYMFKKNGCTFYLSLFARYLETIINCRTRGDNLYNSVECAHHLAGHHICPIGIDNEGHVHIMILTRYIEWSAETMVDKETWIFYSCLGNIYQPSEQYLLCIDIKNEELLCKRHRRVRYDSDIPFDNYYNVTIARLYRILNLIHTCTRRHHRCRSVKSLCELIIIIRYQGQCTDVDVQFQKRYDSSDYECTRFEQYILLPKRDVFIRCTVSIVRDGRNCRNGIFIFDNKKILSVINTQHNGHSTSQRGDSCSSQNQCLHRFAYQVYELVIQKGRYQDGCFCLCTDCCSTLSSTACFFDNHSSGRCPCLQQWHLLRLRKYILLYTGNCNAQLETTSRTSLLKDNTLEYSLYKLLNTFPQQNIQEFSPPNAAIKHWHPADFCTVVSNLQRNVSLVHTTRRKQSVFTDLPDITHHPRLPLSKSSLPVTLQSKLTWNFLPSSFKARSSCRTGRRCSNQKKRKRSLWNVSIIFLLLSVQFTGLRLAGAQGLIGTISTCDNEGEEVQVPSITDNPCIKCICKNNQVECESKRCSNVEGCHAILFDQPTQMCCQVCKGCRYQGAQYDSGDSWKDKKDPCKQFTCRSGVVTVSRVQCFSHCYSTVPVAGQCCPACEGCFFRGHTYSEAERFKLSTDVCTTCTCKNSKLTCEREQCPVLNCPLEVIFKPKNECCPQCRGQRPVFDVPSQCYFSKSVYRKNQQFQPDTCTTCVCKVLDKSSGTSVCEAETCPALDCPEGQRHTLEGSECCVRCSEKRLCEFEGKPYKHKEEWKPNVCITCQCDDGVTYCQRERCSNSLWCPQGYRLLLTENECCPKCIEHDAVCSVFGDPHYRTFDGLMYSFQGTCKYILTRDCSKNDFLIKVRNGVRFSSGFAWTQMLVVFINKHRISLLQNSVVKIDKRRTRLPYNQPGIFSLSKVGELVKLKTNLGLDVTWDGDSFLEVTVTTKYKHRLCGLCGNYNGIKSDDLIGKDGTMYMNGDDYGHSWRIGSTRGCKARPRFQETSPLCERDTRAKQRAHRVCSIFYSRVFTKCRQKVSVDIYVSSCVTDMCDCPEGHYCACEAIRAYTSQCERSGSQVLWDKIKNCHAPQNCPESAVKVDCSELCPKTCDTPNGEGACPEKCLTGCLCPKDKVLHKGECIPVADCPRR